jgi:hypothetical protein
VASALTACLCVGSLCDTRPRGAGLVDLAEAADAAVANHAGGPGSYVTGILGRVDLRTGACALVNAGHTTPLLVRDRQVRPLALPGNFPPACSPDPATAAAEMAKRNGATWTCPPR